MLSTLVLFLALIGGSAAASWKYGDTENKVYGPADWGHVSTECDSSSQSPVNIDTSKVDGAERYIPNVHLLQPNGYTEGTLGNNGQYLTFIVKEGGMTISNPNNGQKYMLRHIDFHFGCDDSVGSEHTVDGKHYPGEMQLIFLNTKYGDDIYTAATTVDGVTIIGVFLKRGRSVPWGLKSLASKVDKISTEGAEMQNVGVYLAALVPNLEWGRLSYYSYQGSFTMPDCYQSVNWLVLQKPIQADESVFENFRKLKSTHGYHHDKMCNNFRPTQPLNGRKIKKHG